MNKNVNMTWRRAFVNKLVNTEFLLGSSKVMFVIANYAFLFNCKKLNYSHMNMVNSVIIIHLKHSDIKCKMEKIENMLNHL